MKKIIIFLFTLFCVVGAKSQSDTIETSPEIAPPPAPEHYDEKMPVFPGGDLELQKFIVKNVVYPKKALKEKIEGTVKVSFVVEKDGSVSDVKVVSKEIGGGCDEEAIRVVRLFPNFTPGTQDGKAAKVKMVVPIRFRLK